jgi:hypothetical protein
MLYRFDQMINFQRIASEIFVKAYLRAAILSEFFLNASNKSLIPSNNRELKNYVIFKNFNKLRQL